MVNLAHALEWQAEKNPEKLFLRGPMGQWTYGEVDKQANRIAHGLQAAGVRPGDHVAVSCAAGPDFVCAFFGILKMGGAVVALNTLLKSNEIAHQLRDAGAVAYLCETGRPEQPVGTSGWAAFQQVEECTHFWLLGDWLEDGSAKPADLATLADLIAGQPDTFETCLRAPGDRCCIVYTSGTTDHAKGAELTHANLMTHWLVLREHLQHTPDDVAVVAAPMYSVIAQSLLMGPIVAAGGGLHLLPRFNPAGVLHAFDADGATFFCGVPAMYHALLGMRDLSEESLARVRESWRCGLVGGAPVPPSLLERVSARFGPKMLIGYGLSETTAAISMHRPDEATPSDCVGKPIWGVLARIVDENMNEAGIGEQGEIVVRGHAVMTGYYGKPELNEQVFRGGWFHTGDVGRRDEAGFLYVVDRLKDVIIRAGRKVVPAEVESLLASHPEVTAAAVVGIPHEELTEEVKAFVVRAPEARVTEEALIAWCRERIAPYACPRLVEFRDALPMGPTGKILRRALRDVQ